MRLDVYLKLSRLIGRRSLAQEFCDKGLVSLNGAVAKSSKEVKTGDAIEIRRRNRVTRLRIVAVPEKKQVAKSESSSLFDVISEENVGENLL